MAASASNLTDPDSRSTGAALLLFSALRGQDFSPERAAELVRQTLEARRAPPTPAELECGRERVNAWLEIGALEGQGRKPCFHCQNGRHCGHCGCCKH